MDEKTKSTLVRFRVGQELCFTPCRILVQASIGILSRLFTVMTTPRD